MDLAGREAELRGWEASLKEREVNSLLRQEAMGAGGAGAVTVGRQVSGQAGMADQEEKEGEGEGEGEVEEEGDDEATRALKRSLADSALLTALVDARLLGGTLSALGVRSVHWRNVHRSS